MSKAFRQTHICAQFTEMLFWGNAWPRSDNIDWLQFRLCGIGSHKRGKHAKLTDIMTI